MTKIRITQNGKHSVKAATVREREREAESERKSEKLGRESGTRRDH